MITYFWGGRSPFSLWHRSHFHAPEPWPGPDQKVVPFVSAEHYLVAASAARDNWRSRYNRILETTDLRDLWRLRSFWPDNWLEEARQHAMTANLAKFGQNTDLQAALLQTGADLLVYADPKCRLWGSGLRADHPDAGNPSKWPGKNWLGEVLMSVRRALREEPDGGKRELPTRIVTL